MKIETLRIWLPRTGVTASQATGDDGYYKAGNPRVTRFVAIGNNTIRDRATGLQWIQNNTTLGSPFNGTRTWANGLADCEALTYGGFSDWRMPNLMEMLSICDWSIATGVRVPSPFAIIGSTYIYYWTSTPYGNAPTSTAMIVGVGAAYGYVVSTEAMTATNKYTLPVRGGRINA